MRIGCLQFAPQIGDVDNNLNRADAVLSRANPKDLDLLVLPELCFSGYNFQSLEHITPYLEPTTAGITSLWARTTALKYNCVVTAGYPEKVDVRAKWPAGPEYYNSAITVNADGETVANYRKTFLYYTDETWALEGKGFYSGPIDGLGNVAMGICMDINPYKFETPWNAWEFSYHVLHKQANLVIMSMAWLTREDITSFSRAPHEPDMETLSYWLSRLEPLIRAESTGEIIVVIANRCGSEGDVVYAGTSTVLGINDGEVKVYGILGRGEKELLVVDTDKRPKAKLVSEPNSAASTATDATAQSANTQVSAADTAYTSPDEDVAIDSNDGYSSLSPKDSKYPSGQSARSSSDDESYYRDPLHSGRSFSGQTPSPRFPISPNSVNNYPPSPQSRGRSRGRAGPAPTGSAIVRAPLITPDAAPTAPTTSQSKAPWEQHECSSATNSNNQTRLINRSPPTLQQPPSPQTRGRLRERSRDPRLEVPTSLSKTTYSPTKSQPSPTQQPSSPPIRGRTRERTRDGTKSSTRDKSIQKVLGSKKEIRSPTLNQPPSPQKRGRKRDRTIELSVAPEVIPEPMLEPEPEAELLSPLTYSPTFSFPSKKSPVASPKVEAPPIPPRGRARDRGDAELSLATRDSTQNTQGKTSNGSTSSIVKSPLPPGSAAPDHYQSFFTSKTLGERSDHFSPRPRSAYW
ncbi:carbon-nitrogen hydrolase [Amylocarpus encephaloides]|uniref:Carbon-nitrogen hydrolase n=1 Tax=Amylocarpus encephaloides TaxID=45428 RepID=A0A9P7YAW4_9HELO|nr:carbon-nitrogen hydrolase [Amylocarpus encephaloides]